MASQLENMTRCIAKDCARRYDCLRYVGPHKPTPRLLGWWGPDYWDADCPGYVDGDQYLADCEGEECRI